jgi:hypothetical protein
MVFYNMLMILRKILKDSCQFWQGRTRPKMGLLKLLRKMGLTFKKQMFFELCLKVIIVSIHKFRVIIGTYSVSPGVNIVRIIH